MEFEEKVFRAVSKEFGRMGHQSYKELTLKDGRRVRVEYKNRMYSAHVLEHGGEFEERMAISGLSRFFIKISKKAAV